MAMGGDKTLHHPKLIYEPDKRGNFIDCRACLAD
jgi:hypothetical protein